MRDDGVGGNDAPEESAEARETQSLGSEMFVGDFATPGVRIVLDGKPVVCGRLD